MSTTAKSKSVSSTPKVLSTFCSLPLLPPMASYNHWSTRFLKSWRMERVREIVRKKGGLTSDEFPNCYNSRLYISIKFPGKEEQYVEFVGEGQPPAPSPCPFPAGTFWFLTPYLVTTLVSPWLIFAGWKWHLRSPATLRSSNLHYTGSSNHHSRQPWSTVKIQLQ